MSGSLLDLLAAWFAREPVPGLLMAVAGVLLFAAGVSNPKRLQTGFGSGPGWLAAAIRQPVLFVSILAAGYFLLSEGYAMARPVAAALGSDEALVAKIAKAREQWGGSVLQHDLEVGFTRSETIVEQIAGPGDRPLYRNRELVIQVDQEGIEGFTGRVDVRVADPALNTFTADARYEYRVVNHAETDTTAEFRFSINAARYYNELRIEMDDREVGYELRGNSAIWQAPLKAGQVARLVIRYSVRGMEAFTFSVPERRGIDRFHFVIFVDSPRFNTVTRPGGDVIGQEILPSGDGFEAVWEINQAIVAPSMGIKFRSTIKPDPSQGEALRIAALAPSGLMFLGVLTILTFLITGVRVHLGRLALQMGAYCALYLGVLGLDLLRVHYLIPMAGLTGLALVLVHLSHRSLPGLTVNLILILTFLFSFCYPLAGWLPDAQARTVFDMVLQAGILLYLFGLSLFMRIRARPILERRK